MIPNDISVLRKNYWSWIRCLVDGIFPLNLGEVLPGWQRKVRESLVPDQEVHLSLLEQERCQLPIMSHEVDACLTIASQILVDSDNQFVRNQLTGDYVTCRTDDAPVRTSRAHPQYYRIEKHDQSYLYRGSGK